MPSHIKKVSYRDSDGTPLKFHWNLNEITLVSLHRTTGLLMLLRFSLTQPAGKVDKIKNQVAKKGSLNNMRPPTGCCLPMQTI